MLKDVGMTVVDKQEQYICSNTCNNNKPETKYIYIQQNRG